MIIIQASAAIVLVFLLLFLIRKNHKLKQQRITIESELAGLSLVYAPVEELESKYEKTKTNYSDLQNLYQSKLQNLNRSEADIELYNTSIGTVDESLYSSTVQPSDLSNLEEKLDDIKGKLKELISNKRACINSFGNDFVVNGKRSEAKKLFNREIKLRLRCMDNEFKAALVTVDWHNVKRLTQKAERLLKQINLSGDITRTKITRAYFDLKVKELKTHYDIKHVKRLAKEIEREEKRLIREQEREQARIENAAKKAEKERLIMEELVKKEMERLNQASPEELELIELHRAELELLKSKETRAKSLAEQTRAGYVYVISNPLSFGDDIVKIGMTRRAEPKDRVKELGDASVPDFFTIHAFMYTDDAPTLEKMLHDEFSEQRVNKVNNRKEFFEIDPKAVLDSLKLLKGAPEYQLVEAF